MKTGWTLRLLAFSGLLAILGCVGQVRVNAVKSAGVDRIPLKLGLYPFLSTAVTDSRVNAYAGARLLDVSVGKMGDDVAILPPANTEMKITQESQIMTDSLSMELSARGFALKQLPVEVSGDKNGEPKDRKGFFIGVNLLEELRSNYGIDAIALCDAFFVLDRSNGGVPEKKVVAAHIKIVDTKTLDVLAQAQLPYRAEGYDLNETVKALAVSLAQLADPESKAGPEPK